MGVFLLLARWLFRRSFSYDPERAAAVMDLDERGAIRDHALLVRCLVVLRRRARRLQPAHGAARRPERGGTAGAGVLVLVSGTTSEEFLEDVEWETLVFFAGCS